LSSSFLSVNVSTPECCFTGIIFHASVPLNSSSHKKNDHMITISIVIGLSSAMFVMIFRHTMWKMSTAMKIWFMHNFDKSQEE
jgi:hypothetical protein